MVVLCRHDGVRVAQSRTGRWVHLDSLPDGAEDHEIDPIDATTFGDATAERDVLREAALDMLQHHATTHPQKDCPWITNLARALRRE